MSRKPGFAKGLIPDSVLKVLFDPKLDEEILQLFYSGELLPSGDLDVDR